MLYCILLYLHKRWHAHRLDSTLCSAELTLRSTWPRYGTYLHTFRSNCTRCGTPLHTPGLDVTCKLCRALCKELALFSHLYSRTAPICTRCGTLTLGLDVAHRLWPAGGSGPACHHRSTTLTASVPSAL